MIHYQHIVAPVLRHLRGVDAVPATRAALDLLLDGDLAGADSALAALSPDSTTLCALGFIAYQNREGDRALALVTRAAESAPAAAIVHALLGTCQLAAGRYEQAIPALRAALTQDPALHAAHTLLWSALDGIGTAPAAITALKAELLALWQASPTVTADTNPVEIEHTTLLVLDHANPALAQRALALSMSGCRFEHVKWLTNSAIVVPGVETVVTTPILSHADYSRFMVKDLLAYVDTDHVLVAQWDGHVVNPAAWSPEFLLFDYIGARWDNTLHRTAAHHNVGNGGFSLRSRALLEALQDPAIEVTLAEDATICRQYRGYLEDRHGIVFAPDAIADRFAFEHFEQPSMSFGFHGVSNLARFVGAPGWATLDFHFR